MREYDNHDLDRRRFLKLFGNAAVAVPVGLSGCTSNNSGGSAGDFPSKTITYIVPYSAGGGFDTYSRGLAESMPKHLPNNPDIVVENIPGAGGRKGATKISRAKADGYTIGIFNIPGMIASQIVMKTQYNLSKISWVGRVARSVYILGVSSDSKFKSLKDLQTAEQVKFAVTGPGSTSYLSAIIAASAMNINAKFVTGYSGSQESVAAALRGDVDAIQYPSSSPSIQNPIQEGEIRPLLYYASEAPEWVSDTKTIDDTEYTDLAEQVNLQRCIGGPPNIPEDHLTILRKSFKQTVQSQEFKQWAKKQERPLGYASGKETAEIISNAQKTFEKYRDLLEKRYK